MKRTTRQIAPLFFGNRFLFIQKYRKTSFGRVARPVHGARLALALVWLYHGLWCKLLGHAPDQARIVDAAPGGGDVALILIGIAEVALAAWIVAGGAPRAAATTQTLLLIAMNAAGLWFAPQLIYDPAAMIVNNLALIALAWLIATHPHPQGATP